MFLISTRSEIVKAETLRCAQSDNTEMSVVRVEILYFIQNERENANDSKMFSC